MNRIKRWIYQKTFNASDRMEIYDSFRQYLLDGLSAQTTFEKLIDNYTRRGKKKGDPTGEILTECSQNLKAGFSLSESFKEWIPDQELSIIESCDKAGKLVDGFKNAMIIAEGTGKISGSVYSTLVSFIYIQSLAIGLVVIFCIALVPTLEQSVPLEKWNTLQIGVWYFYVAVTDYWYLMLAVVIALTVVINKSLTIWTGNIRFWFDRFPPWSVYRRLQGAAFILNVNAMLSAGIPIETAIRGMVESSTSPWLLERLEAILRNIEAGEKNLGAAMDATGYEFPGEDAIIKMQSLFETANQENSLHRFAKKWLDKTVKTVEKSGTVIQVMGYFWIAIAILLLILVMSDLIQQAFFM